jgi:hypothetical protein
MYLGIPLLVTLPAAQVDAVAGRELVLHASGQARVGADRELAADAEAARLLGPLQLAQALRGARSAHAAWTEFLSMRMTLAALQSSRGDRLWEGIWDPFEEFRARCLSSPELRHAWEAAAEDAAHSRPSLEERLSRVLREKVTALTDVPAPPVNPRPPDLPLSRRERTRLLRAELDEETPRQGPAPPPPPPSRPAPVPSRPARASRVRGWRSRHRGTFAIATFLAAIVGLITALAAHGRPADVTVTGPTACDPSEPYSPVNMCGFLEPTPGWQDPFPLPTWTLPPVSVPSLPLPSVLAPLVTHVTVRPGDTLASIACHYLTTVATIQQLNHLGRSTMIRVGEKLAVAYTFVVSTRC